MEISREKLKELSYRELEELYGWYYRLGSNAIRYDINQGLALFDIADMIKNEADRRNNSEVKKKTL